MGEIFVDQTGVGVRVRITHKADINLNLASSIVLRVRTPSQVLKEWAAAITESGATHTVVEATADGLTEAGEWRLQVKAVFSGAPTPLYSAIGRFPIANYL